MRPIILGKNLLTDDEILAFAMSEDNFRLLTLDQLYHHAVTAALLTASMLVRLQSTTDADRLRLPTDTRSADSGRDT